MIFAETPLSKVARHLDPNSLADCEVVGISGDGQVLCFRAEDSMVYSTGLLIDEFITSSRGWTMTMTESERVGVLNYREYIMVRKMVASHEDNPGSEFARAREEAPAYSMAM